MTTQHALALILAAVLVFWGVGAYNRLVRLRNEVARAYAPLEAQVGQRHVLLLAWAQALRPSLDALPQAVDAMCGAAEQLLVASARAHQRPTSARTIASLRLAEETLAAARERLSADLPAHLHQTHLSDASIGLSGVNDELAAAGSTLVFARAQFNAAVEEYNEAIRQFPTLLIANLFGFRLAGAL